MNGWMRLSVTPKELNSLILRPPSLTLRICDYSGWPNMPLLRAGVVEAFDILLLGHFRMPKLMLDWTWIEFQTFQKPGGTLTALFSIIP
jgi:hypothetical protein